MAVLPPGNKPPGRRPSMRGILMQDVSQGVERNRAWPKKRGRPKNSTTREQNEWFRQAQAATKYIDAQLMTSVMEATAGTPLLPRDLLTMMFANRFIMIEMPDGRKLYPVTAKRDVSDSLDTLGQTVGFTLRRGTQFWEAVPYQDLTYYGATASRSTDQSISHETFTPIIFTGVEDPDHIWWNVSNPTRLTVPPNVNRVRLTASARRASQTGQFLIYITKNGQSAPDVMGLPWQDTDTASTDFNSIASAAIPVVEGDYFELIAFMTNTANVTWAWLGVEKVA